MKEHYLSDRHQLTLLTIASEYVNGRVQQSLNHDCSEAMKKEFNDILGNIDTLSSGCEIVADDMTRLKIEEGQIKTNSEQNLSVIEELKKQENDDEKKFKKLLESQTDMQKELEDIKIKREESQVLILDAHSTTTLYFNYPNTSFFSLESSKFKTSQYGYLFMLRVCSTIESKQEYLSVFLTLYNSEYSNIISYPFSYNIHLALWDQSNQQKHIVSIVKPDQTSSSFTRPTSEKNDEFGIKKFCLLKYLTDSQSRYLRDGRFFVRVFIDFLNTGQGPFQSKSHVETDEVMSSTTMVTE